SALGLYGLLSASVTERRSEIGVRVAMGATAGTVLRMILKDALRLIGWGILVGVGGLFFAECLGGEVVFKISAFGPRRIAGVARALMIVRILAAVVPALRAAKLDPIEALRTE